MQDKKKEMRKTDRALSKAAWIIPFFRSGKVQDGEGRGVILKKKKPTHGRSDNAINQPIFSYWEAIYKSFYSPYLYIDVAKRWTGIGLLYLLLIAALFTIPLTVRLSHDFNHHFNTEIIDPINLLPVLYVQNGALQFDKPMPYLIKNKNEQVVAIIDTHDSAVADDYFKKYPTLSFLFSKNALYFGLPTLKSLLSPTHEKKISIQEQKFAENTNEIFNGGESIKSGGIIKLKWFAEFLFYPILVSLFFCSYIVFIPMIAFVGSMIATVFFKFKLNYKQACRVMVVAATPQMALLMLLSTFNGIREGQGFIHLIVLGVYFYFAVLSISRESKRMQALPVKY